MKDRKQWCSMSNKGSLHLSPLSQCNHRRANQSETLWSFHLSSPTLSSSSSPLIPYLSLSYPLFPYPLPTSTTTDGCGMTQLLCPTQVPLCSFCCPARQPEPAEPDKFTWRSLAPRPAPYTHPPTPTHPNTMRTDPPTPHPSNPSSSLCKD